MRVGLLVCVVACTPAVVITTPRPTTTWKTVPAPGPVSLGGVAQPVRVEPVMHDPPWLDLRALEPPAVPHDLEPSLPSVHASWPGVCVRRGAMSDDKLAYVEAWCASMKRGWPAAIAALGALMTSSVGGAAEHDAIVIAAETTAGPEDAERALAGIPIVPAIARLELADAYLVAGRDGDAREVGGARVVCTFAIRDALAAADRDLSATLAAARDGACATLAGAIERTIATSDRPEALLARVLAAWGDGAWPALAGTAERAIPFPGAEETALTALANLLRRRCDGGGLALVADHLAHLRARPDHDASLDPILARLTNRCVH